MILVEKIMHQIQCTGLIRQTPFPELFFAGGGAGVYDFLDMYLSKY